MGTTLVISVAKPNLLLKNMTANTIRFIAVEDDVATRALFAACDTTCPSVAPGATVTFPLTEVYGYTSASTAAIVMSWEFAPTPRDRVDTSLVSTRVRLR